VPNKYLLTIREFRIDNFIVSGVIKNERLIYNFSFCIDTILD